MCRRRRGRPIVLPLTCARRRTFGPTPFERHGQLRQCAVNMTLGKMRHPGLFIYLVEVKKENWLFGNGEARYVQP
jgi:hypothetical protein